MKEMLEEYGGLITGVLVAVATLGMLGSMLTATLSGSITEFSTILYG